MAKQSIVKVIRAKPNQRGVTSHIPFQCYVKDCDNEVLQITGTFYTRKKVCLPHYENPPQGRRDANIAKMKSLGLIP